MEEYREIPGYPDYEVSNLGRVKNIKTGHIFKPTTGKGGYLVVGIRTCGIRKAFRIHKLVAMAFLDHVPDGTQRFVVDHINNDPLDNRLENLQIITNRLNVSKNIVRDLPTGVYQKPSGRYSAKISFGYESYYLGTFDTIEEASNAYQEVIKKQSPMARTLFKSKNNNIVLPQKL